MFYIFLWCTQVPLQSCHLLPIIQTCIIELHLQQTLEFCLCTEKKSVPTLAAVQVFPLVLFRIHSEVPLGLQAQGPTSVDDSIFLFVTLKMSSVPEFPHGSSRLRVCTERGPMWACMLIAWMPEPKALVGQSATYPLQRKMIYSISIYGNRGGLKHSVTLEGIKHKQDRYWNNAELQTGNKSIM